MRRRHVTAIVALAATAILLGGIAVWARGESARSEGGPLAYPSDLSDRLSFTVGVGRPYSWGLILLQNAGKAPAVVEGIELVNENGSLRLVGAYAVPERTEMGIGFAPGFQADAGQPLDGLVIAPGAGKGYQVVVGLQVDAAGLSSFTDVRLEYHVGEIRYATTLKHAVNLCAPVEKYDDCPLPPERPPPPTRSTQTTAYLDRGIAARPRAFDATS